MAAMELGKTDMAARYQIDELGWDQGRLAAASLAATIQVAVDRQKRKYAYPAGCGIADLPKKDGEKTYLTKLLKSIKQPTSDYTEDKTSPNHEWDLVVETYKHISVLKEGVDYKGVPIQAPEGMLEALLVPSATYIMFCEAACAALMGKNKSQPRLGVYPNTNSLPVNKEFPEWRAKNPANNQELIEMNRAVRALFPNRKLHKAMQRVVSEWAKQNGLLEEVAINTENEMDWLKYATVEQIKDLYGEAHPNFRITRFAKHGLVFRVMGATWERVDNEWVNVQDEVVGGKAYHAGELKLIADNKTRQVTLYILSLIHI